MRSLVSARLTSRGVREQTELLCAADVNHVPSQALALSPVQQSGAGPRARWPEPLQ